MSDEVYEGAIGIDLGTTYSYAILFLSSPSLCQTDKRVAVSPTMKAPMSKSVRYLQRITSSRETILTFSTSVANEQGSFTTPSFVSFTSEERLIGEAAKNLAAMNPINTVFDVKLVSRVFPGTASVLSY